MSNQSAGNDADRDLLAAVIERAYPGQVNGWYLADLILEAGFTRPIPPERSLAERVRDLGIEPVGTDIDIETGKRVAPAR